MPPEFWIEVEESGQRQRVPLTGSEIFLRRLTRERCTTPALEQSTDIEALLPIKEGIIRMLTKNP